MSEWSMKHLLARALRVLAKHKLVILSQGNISVRGKGNNIFIKASGVVCEDAKAASVVIVDAVTGDLIVDDCLKPSTDLESHLHIYRSCPDVNAIVHTHSTYATAFAAAGVDIPVSLTSMADVFGGPIPALPYASIGGVDIGKGVVEQLHKRFTKAMLLTQHGVITVGSNLTEAVNAAIFAEDCAKTLLFSSALWNWPALPHPLTHDEVQKAHNRYTNDYGQRDDD